jgi:hypothetical protein
MQQPDAPGATEQDTWAEHRAALDATLFPAPAATVLELRDGELGPVDRKRPQAARSEPKANEAAQ